MNVEMQQISQSSNHKEDENDYTQQEEILEEIFYEPQAEEKVVHFCDSLQQLASKNDLYNEENYIVCGHHLERQLDRISNKFGMAEDQLFEDIECYENHQTNHLFFDPIADYMEKIYCSGFQLYVHLEEQLHLILPWLLQYLVNFCFKHNQRIQVLDQIDDWLHWKFHVP